MRTLILLLCSLSCFAQRPLSTKDATGKESFPPLEIITHDTAASDYWQCFTADGDTVVFSRALNGMKRKLYKVPVKGGNATRFLPELKNLKLGETRPNTAKDGQIAFTGIDSATSIWLTNGQGGTATRVHTTNMLGNPSYPCWYPGEKKLMVVAYQHQEAGILTSVDLTNGHCVLLTDSNTISAGMPNLSPDGKLVAFAGQRPNGKYRQNNNRIWLAKVNGDQLLDPYPLDSCQGRAPSWSPDGKWIAYESTCGACDTCYAIIISSVDGKHQRRITEYSWGANHPVWSPDGNTLVMSVIRPEHRGKTAMAVIHHVKKWLPGIPAK